MVLIDFSSIMHRKIFTSITNMKPAKEDGKYVTSEFIGLTKYQILKELFDISKDYESKYGDMVICLDNKSLEGYWRRDFYKPYKSGRSKNREESDINFKEVFAELNVLTDTIIKYLPWKSVEVFRAEADDVILVLADEAIKGNIPLKKNKVLIHSPDKDFIQSQFGNDIVTQYSALTNKWVVPETKNSDMDGWLLEHICLGDVADEVPKIVDHTEFSDNFIAYLQENDIEQLTPKEFKESVPKELKIKLLSEYDVYCYNRAGERQEKDVYKKIRFGSTTLEKAIKKHGSLDDFLDSHPLYREHYERNRVLVLTEGIPDYIREGVVKEFANATDSYNHSEFEEYLKENNLSSMLLELPQSFSTKRGEISEEDFW